MCPSEEPGEIMGETRGFGGFSIVLGVSKQSLPNSLSAQIPILGLFNSVGVKKFTVPHTMGICRC